MVSKNDQQQLLRVDLTAVCEDVSSPIEKLVHAGLRFLGYLALLNKILVEKQQKVVKTLADKSIELCRNRTTNMQTCKLVLSIDDFP